MAEQFANNAQTTLTSGVGLAQPTLPVVSTASFPSSTPFRVIVDNEIMVVTGKTVNSLNVLRGQESTALATHSSGAAVKHVLTAGAINQLKADVPGPNFAYLPMVSGVVSAGTIYKVLGALGAREWGTLITGDTLTYTFQAVINVPDGSTAQIRLYDMTNHNTLWESGVIAGPLVNYEINQSVTPAAGSTILETWLSTPTNVGGDASCMSAGILVTGS